MNIWQLFLFQPFVNLLIVFYNLFNNMGLAIIGLTITIRAVLLPITAKQLKTAEKMKKLAPELESLKKKHGHDKQLFAQKQLKLYQRHGANPASGCLPTIIQFVVLIALFQALNQVLQANGEVIVKLNEVLYSFLKLPTDLILKTKFLYLDITKPDTLALPFAIKLPFVTINAAPGIFLLSAAAVQFLSSKLMLPAKDKIKAAQSKKQGEAEDMMGAMQSQMVFFAPLMTLVVGFRFPSGLVLYWFTFSLFMLIQQLLIKKIKQKNAKRH